MEETLRALGDLIIQALPTFFLVILLHFFLKSVFFKPLEKVLKARTEATEGARRAAAASLASAEAKAAAYEESLRAARNEIYQEQEQTRRQWRAQQTSQIQDGRRRADQLVKDAQAQLAVQAAAAKAELNANAQSLANQITDAVLKGRA
jgi:F-type H+-transporting ATPase subunit b